MADVRPIDANALKSAFNTDVQTAMFSWNADLLQVLMIEIDEAPTIEYAPVRHGEWMIHHYNSETYEYEDVPYNPSSFDNPSGNLFCSVCDADSLLNAHEEDVPSRYCPNCGARMDGGKHDD